MCRTAVLGPATADLLRGQVQIMFIGLPPSLEHIRSGRLRALAVTTATRFEACGAACRHRLSQGCRSRKSEGRAGDESASQCRLRGRDGGFDGHERLMGSSALTTKSGVNGVTKQEIKKERNNSGIDTLKCLPRLLEQTQCFSSC
jgi:Tripartite tricarboxylate transporter family receptor